MSKKTLHDESLKIKFGLKDNINKYGDTYKSNSKTTNSIVTEIQAVKIIEKAWFSYRDKQMFRLLKHSICAAEHSLSKEILKRISPLEVNLLNDPCLNVRIKFRFAGEEFPPFIVFKIYSQLGEGNSTKYINGKNMIKPSTTAAQEACSQMGNRQFYNIMILDSLQEQNKGKITDKEHVVSLKEYMQYSSLIDDLPAYMGGRSNSWRRLNLNDLPRHTIFYDIINYAFTKKMSSNLAKELPILLKPPLNSDIQSEHIKLLSKLDIHNNDFTNPSITYLNSSHYKSTISQVSSRRSKNAVNKVSRMKKAYSMARSESVATENIEPFNSSGPHTESFKLPEDLNDEFEEEVKHLYMWTKNLSINDDYMNSPRLPNSLN